MDATEDTLVGTRIVFCADGIKLPARCTDRKVVAATAVVKWIDENGNGIGTREFVMRAHPTHDVFRLTIVAAKPNVQIVLIVEKACFSSFAYRLTKLWPCLNEVGHRSDCLPYWLVKPSIPLN